MDDISYPEAIAGFRDLSHEIGPRCDAYVTLACGAYDNRDVIWSATVYPNGMSASSYGGDIKATSDTLRDLLASLRAEWIARRAKHDKVRTDSMAAAIIRFIGGMGYCADSELRLAGFSDDEIKRLGPAACERANEMASRGPFSIMAGAKPNGAPVLMAAE